MKYDVVVVGAGPAGSIASRYAALNGASVLLIEEHQSIGSPVGCTGLLSTRAVSECDLEPSDDFVLNNVKGAFIYSTDGIPLQIDGGQTKAYVVSRKTFDRKLAQTAVESGVDILLRTKAVGIENSSSIQKLHVLKEGVKQTIKAHVVIGADGIRSNISKMVGLGNVEKIVSGIQVDGVYESKNSEFVELFPGSYAPGFFAWTVPLSKSISRIGLGTTEPDAVKYLNHLIKSNPEISERYQGSMMDFVVGAIPLGTLDKTFTDGVIVVGDAAGQVKPTSGGGIYPGAVCAKIAGEVAAKSALKADPSKNSLVEYEKRWKSNIGKELDTGMKIHEFITNLKDEQLNDLLHSMNNPKILDTITKYGDMDHPSILVKKMMHPSNLKPGLKICWSLAKTVI
ncbi:geranylgeranyl reductase [Methanohalobium evestigatum Z-7303]|uniref:Geranylgeranyl reductase n=1 Tax=Methanohalobium evestigatum (strain ATCC BAA-1072 / DSM 3721 / NBRC 107634 / OCM 161 / Z-7303) TaxID=644295 RepID=D7E8N0_METEZ|nr:NAD(P)/FAD-dependent oxidoreductase [Methanohalobium evestigatum]ADI73701.1 geranylgeranyl reductase [Methanohalobium evestigatum Z-7303]